LSSYNVVIISPFSRLTWLWLLFFVVIVKSSPLHLPDFLNFRKVFCASLDLSKKKWKYTEETTYLDRENPLASNPEFKIIGCQKNQFRGSLPFFSFGKIQ